MLAWQSLDTWLVTFISIAYLSFLFVVAYWGQHSKTWTNKPWVYSLSLGVSCTSWAFYGTVGQAAQTREWLAPIYIGTILFFIFAWPMLLKTLRIIKQQNLTSLADFIACRYDKSPKVAAVVALVALAGLVPYIALQLRAISASFDLLTGTFQIGVSTAFIVTLVLIAFSILFGTQQLSASKQNPGLVLAIAFSSIVKLLALTAIGIFATFFLFDGFADLRDKQALIEAPVESSSWYLGLAQAVLGAITIFILPQQFHMTMIENHRESELRTARWLYPVYLIAINVFVLPIAIAGLLSFPGGSVNPDSFVLSLPLFHQQAWLGVLAYVGGLAAATSMVVIAAIVLSTMISTEILTPVILKFKLYSSKAAPQLSGLLLNLRRITIAVILLMAFTFERLVGQQSHLASIGLLSFVLLSQFAPAVFGALYWRKATTSAALSSVLIGSMVWLYTLLLPLIFTTASWVEHGPLNIAWLKPQALFGVNSLDSISHGVFFSLALNLLCFILVSLFSRRSIGEQLQAEVFVNKKKSPNQRQLTTKDLYSLLQRFISKQAADDLLVYAKAQGIHPSKTSDELIEYTQLQLSGVLGSASTSMVMNAAANIEEVPLADVVSIVDEASKMFQFNRELLQSGVENIEQGISVIDSQMRLVAWNNRYIELLDYPAELVVAGMPIEVLIRFNVERGIISGDEADALVAKRVEHMRLGTRHYFQRTMPNGTVLEIRGQPMPGGGFVSTFSDISAHIEAEKALQQANELLEKRVAIRTEELQKAKAQAEAANSSKTRFLAAASHDLMQPFNALSLFTSMLKKKVQGQELTELANHIDDSLTVVEALLSDLVEISRLDGGSEKTEPSTFALSELLTPLNNEFTALAQQADIEFCFVDSAVVIATDKRLLRRILQNFLSNAVHYCQAPTNQVARDAKILLGVRRHQNNIRIQVWDNGPGIPEDKQKTIFQEFERLEQNREIPGLGLGLAISERIASLLGLQIGVCSTVGKGTCFMIDVPRSYQSLATSEQTNANGSDAKASSQMNLSVVLLDNDPLMLTALSSQLTEWGCDVVIAKDEASLVQCVDQLSAEPELIIADYHLDDQQNGVDVIESLLAKHNWQVPCVICSADPSESVRQHTSNANFQFLRKPIKPLALKRLIKQLIPN
ncbi:PAS-domain containing protein [Thalassotalea sp. LPB0316]|uniref:hybrid sensor histidine kinase/response regulator n=1 Tax=Thalassotalea sp. LPB0316 TaxID=2769490 RepID=UPI001867DA89|nr:PAS domain-containing hybrid sensor histidine kinase/response regulator [Thalassotalea sp. LPB0316]QOL26054.1 PAS-domain containing protein [Thalassotalea sp. LPB0316]